MARIRGVTEAGHRSKFEDRMALDLSARGVEYKYEQYSYEYEEPLRKNQASCAACGSTTLVRTGWYTPDFFLENGVIVETKGRFTAADRRKMVAVRESHPDLDVKLLFMRNNKIHKNSTTTYADWAEKNGFDYCINEWKEEWLL
jgi:hypothetical protein